MQVDYQKVKGDRRLPKLCAVSFFVPAIAREPHVPGGGRLAHLDIRARWAQISEELPDWLHYAVYASFGRAEGINTHPSRVPPDQYVRYAHAIGAFRKQSALVQAPG